MRNHEAKVTRKALHAEKEKEKERTDSSEEETGGLSEFTFKLGFSDGRMKIDKIQKNLSTNFVRTLIPAGE